MGIVKFDDIVSLFFTIRGKTLIDVEHCLICGKITSCFNVQNFVMFSFHGYLSIIDTLSLQTRDCNVKNEVFFTKFSEAGHVIIFIIYKVIQSSYLIKDHPEIYIQLYSIYALLLIQ